MMLLIVFSLLSASVAHATDTLKDPQIPDLFPPRADTISLIAQVVTANGIQTREEITDRKSAKQKISITNHDSKKSLFLATSGIFEYEPYFCKKITPKQMADDPAYKGLMTFEAEKLPIYGISAIWMNARSKGWKQEKDGVWQADDPETKNRVRLFVNTVGGQDVVETITLSTREDESRDKIHTMINIISIEEPRRNDLLQVPTGYGCVNDEKPFSLSYVTNHIVADSPFFALNLEVSATKYSATPYPGGSTSSTDFLGLELVYSKDVGLQLIRRKESNKDSKTIVDLKHRVTYELDEMRGSCERRHNRGSLDGSPVGESQFLDTKIDFSNGLSLEVNVKKLKQLFTDAEDFYLVKEIPDGDGNIGDSFHYYEASIKNSEDFLVGYVTRRYFKAQAARLLKLSSVELRLIGANLSRIDESYLFNSIDLVDSENAQFNLIPWMDNINPGDPKLGRQLLNLARLFDISEECYVESESQRVGHDFVWIEMSYMLPNQELQSLQGGRDLLEAGLYGQLLSNWRENGLTILRVPKFEVILSLKQDLLILRLLVLDMPSINVMFKEEQNLLINANASFGDTTEFARDLEHCTSLCRLSHCQLMTFGQGDHKCILSRHPPEEHTHATAGGYRTFYFEKLDDEMFDFDTLKLGSLRMIMRLLQSCQYDEYLIPEKPEDIQRAPDPYAEKSIKEQYRQMTEEYWISLLNSLPSKDDRKMVFRYTDPSGLDHQLVPKNYFFEADPLSEFNLDDFDKNNLVDLEEDVPTFHRGFPFLRFKPDLDVTRYNAHYFGGVSIEQCELACLDGICSSYSYCESNNRRECTITSIHSLSELEKMDQVTPDHDCFIAQRDFLSKYNRFENVLSPQTSGEIIVKHDSINPTECAYQCFINSEKGTCLAFDYCIEPMGQNAECFLLRRREIYTGADDGSTNPDSKKPDNPDQKTGCDHYSRSYLADFWRIEYTEIKPDELAKLNPATFTGLTVDRCADKCVTEDNKCSGFQFCFLGDKKSGGGDATDMTQTCQLIDSPPKEELEIDEDQSGHATKKGSFIILSPGSNCHLFIMRSDADEAKLRDLAFNRTKPFEPNKDDDDAKSSTGISVLSGLIIYMCVTVVAAAIGSGFVVMKHNNIKFRQQVERFSFWLRIRRS